MPHIDVDKTLPGIRSLMAFRPETAEPLSALAEVLLRDTTGLSPAERELIATYVSYLNDCFYCHNSHGEIAVCYLDGDRDLVEMVRKNYKEAPISEKLKSLLQIAGKVQKSGKSVTAGRHRKRAATRSHRQGHSRYGFNCSSILFVQSICRWPRFHSAAGSFYISRKSETDCGTGIRGAYLFENIKRYMVMRYGI